MFRLPNGEPDLPRVGRALVQLGSFRNKEEDFAEVDEMQIGEDAPAYQWWQLNGCSTPDLQYIAVRVLSMVSSVGACERNWSAYDFLHSKKRNRLEPQRANDLVYVFANLRLINRMRSDELFAEWDAIEEAEEAEEDEDEAAAGAAAAPAASEATGPSAAQADDNGDYAEEGDWALRMLTGGEPPI